MGHPNVNSGAHLKFSVHGQKAKTPLRGRPKDRKSLKDSFYDHQKNHLAED